MARPRVIRIDEKREIHMLNMSAEDAARIRALFDGAPVATETDEPKAQAPLTQVALGSYKDAAQQWHFVEVMYNPDTKEAAVTNDRQIGNDRRFAIDEFKKSAVTKNLV